VASQEGLIQFTAYTNKDIFFSLQAPTLQGTWTGDWAVDVGASTQGKTMDKKNRSATHDSVNFYYYFWP
jgi:hypothetical protein